MKIIKKKQIIVYVIVLILMVAGYLNYTQVTKDKVSLETAMQMESKDGTEVADIGDAKLVNSDDVSKEKEENTTTETTNEITQDVNTTQNDNENIVNEDNTTSVETSTKNNNDYFVQSKLERDTMYSQMLESYDKVLNSTNSIETQKQSATEEIQKINNIKNSIMICENLIKTKGFENNVIFVNGKSINVIVESKELKQEQIAQIQNIVSREMNSEIDDIHISNK